MSKRAELLDVAKDNGIALSKEKKDKRTKLVIPELNVKMLQVRIRGISPLIIRAWDDKTAQQLADKAMGIKAPAARPNVDPEATWNAARYISTDGWDGIPCGAFRAAIIESIDCVDVPKNDFSMTRGKKTIFVLPDGIHPQSQRELVRIYGKPECYALMQPTSGGGPYMSYRPRFNEWECRLRVQFNASRIDAQGVLNLVSIAGYFVGVGEHRPTAPDSKTGSSGRWEVIAQK